MVLLMRSNIKKYIHGKKWIDRQYHVQDNDAVAHQYMKMHCNTNKLPA